MKTLIFAILLTFLAAPSHAQELRADIEIDPIAFGLEGFSLHAGIGHGRYRLDLGVFGLALPEFFHGQEGFDASFTGYGVKFDIFLDEDGWGPFAGVEGGYTTLHVVDPSTQVQGTDAALSAGVRVGWRVELPQDFYVTPWVGVGWRLGNDVQIGERLYESNPLTIFPTLHLGRRF